MVVAAMANPPGRRRARRVIPAALVLALVGVGGARFVSAFRKARNELHASSTT